MKRLSRFTRVCKSCNEFFETSAKYGQKCNSCSKSSNESRVRNSILKNRDRNSPDAIAVGKSFGYKKCPKWLKRLYLEGANNKCQLCGVKKTLEIHRIKRGNKGGLYTVCKLNHVDSNIKVLCSMCHNNIHYNENNRK